MRSALPGWILFCLLLLLCNTYNEPSVPPAYVLVASW